MPRENGVHLIHVRQNGVPIHGSPFRVLVGKLDADAAKVRAFGDGLTKGETGNFYLFMDLQQRNHQLQPTSRLDLFVYFRFFTYAVGLRLLHIFELLLKLCVTNLLCYCDNNYDSRP